MTTAPTLAIASSTTAVLALTTPPSIPCDTRHASSSTTHPCRSSPATPSGSASLWFGPATYPSNDMEMWNRIMVPILARSLTGVEPPAGDGPGPRLPFPPWS
jgi:hypothetical protein